MLRALAVIFLILGIWGVIENLGVGSQDVYDDMDKAFFASLQELSIIGPILIFIKKVNVFIAIIPLVLSFLIFGKHYAKAHWLSMSLLITKLITYPFLAIILYKRYLFEVARGKPASMELSSAGFVAICMLVVPFLYLLSSHLLAKKLQKINENNNQ